MRSTTSDRSLVAFLVGIVVGALGYQRLEQMNAHVADRVREDADRKLTSLVIEAIAKRLHIPTPTLYKVLDSPDHDLDAYQALRSAYRGCSIIFVNNGSSTVDATVEIAWSDHTGTIIGTPWPWDRLPLEVRRELLRKNRPVKMNWTLPIAERSAHANGSI